MSVILFALIASIIIVACVALEPVEARFRNRRRIAREQAFAVALGQRLAPMIREAIEARARDLAAQQVQAIIPARGPGGKFVKRS